MKRSVIPNMLIITALIMVLFLLNVALGSVSIPTRAAWNILLGASDHRILTPACVLMGALFALACSLIARMPGIEGALPVNSVTALVGAPIAISVLFRRRKEDTAE